MRSRRRGKALAEKKEPDPRSDAMDDDRTHQAIDRHLMMRLWAFLLPYKRTAASCVGLSIVIALLRLSQPVVVHRIIDREVAAGDSAGIARMSLLFFAIVLLVLIFEIIFNYTTQKLGQFSMHDLRVAIFRHVGRLDVAFFDRNPVGRLVTRMTSDVATLNELFATGVVAILAESVLILGLIGIMYVYNARLTLVVLSAVPFMYLALTFFRGYARKWYLEGRRRLAQMNAFLQENIAGMNTVQSFNREEKNLGHFAGLNEFYRAAQVHTIMGFALFFPALNLILYLTLTSVLWFGGQAVLAGRLAGDEPLSFATLFLFVQCVNMLFTPLRNLSEKYNILQSAMASSARIFHLLDTETHVTQPEGASAPKRLERSIRFEHVDFEYVQGEAVLRDVSFEIKRGQTVAVVGATGSGKTTLVNLLTRFYDVRQGAIKFDGRDIREFDLNRYRRLFAIVLQEVFLFSDTIAGNLRLTNPDLTDEEIWDLLAQVHAEEFVRALPEGLQTPVQERGAAFSTGQKQLLAFARALAADPQILILDEATANIDTATEQKIQQAIARMLEGRTALVIAHRISTIRKADLILAMHKGRIREAGTHEELIERDGLYRRLYELQFQSEQVAGQVS